MPPVLKNFSPPSLGVVFWLERRIKTLSGQFADHFASKLFSLVAAEPKYFETILLGLIHLVYNGQLPTLDIMKQSTDFTRVFDRLKSWVRRAEIIGHRSPNFQNTPDQKKLKTPHPPVGTLSL